MGGNIEHEMGTGAISGSLRRLLTLSPRVYVRLGFRVLGKWEPKDGFHHGISRAFRGNSMACRGYKYTLNPKHEPLNPILTKSP